MPKILLAAVLGGLVYFIVSYLSWVVLPFHERMIHGCGDDPRAEAMLELFDSSGVYHHPGFPAGDADTAAVARSTQANRVTFLVFSAEACDPFWLKLLRTFGGDVAVALLIALLLRAANRPSYPGRVLFVFGVACAAAIIAQFENWNFWEFPTDYVLLGAADTVAGWTLAGLIIAKLVHPVRFPKVS